jgi:hypothetical protein
MLEGGGSLEPDQIKALEEESGTETADSAPPALPEPAPALPEPAPAVPEPTTDGDLPGNAPERGAMPEQLAEGPDPESEPLAAAVGNDPPPRAQPATSIDSVTMSPVPDREPEPEQQLRAQPTPSPSSPQVEVAPQAVEAPEPTAEEPKLADLPDPYAGRSVSELGDSLHDAAASGSAEKVQKALKSMLSVDSLSESNTEGWMPCHYAAINPDIQSLKLLLDAGSPPNLQVRRRYSP